ncbi:MAG: hypothetical protein LUF85_04145 [Bacteroides sp.]|nr:hypothetical protein [Bacteroides sp.]
MARCRAEGLILGSLVGSRNVIYTLTGKDALMDKMLAEGKSKSAIARKLEVHRCTWINWLKRRDQEKTMQD